MRPRPFRCAGLLLLGGLGGVLPVSGTHGQPPAAPKALPPELLPPTPIGPAPKAVAPAVAVSPARKPAPFDRFRKYDDLPDLTRELVFATQRGMEWLSRDGIHLPTGRFLPGLDPALGRATDDDHYVRQCLAAFALARAARLTGDEKYAVRAGQSILSLLAEAPKDAAGTRKPVLPAVLCNRVGGAAHLALAIYELPDADPELKQCGEDLCAFLRTRLGEDGCIRCAEAGETDAATAGRYAGPALAALAASHRATPADWKKDALARGLGCCRQQFRTGPDPAVVPWLLAACADFHAQAKDATAVEFAFEMADWLVKLQYDTPDRLRAGWRGGFPTVSGGKVVSSPPTTDTALCAMGLADACRLIRQTDRPDTGRYDRYRAALTRALQFVATLQYGEENTQHFAGHFRPAVLGAFHPSLTDGTVRVDHTAAAVAALSQFLIVGADR